jgi:hypothetical protein
MVGTIVIRAMLVIALIATAHIIKPFSITGTVDRMLVVAGAVSDYLPEETRIGFNHANFLAMSLSRSLFGGRCFDGAEANDVLAMRVVQPAQPTRAAKVWPPTELEKPGRKVKPAPRRSGPAKRIDRIESNNIATLVSAGDDRVLWDETPITGAAAMKASLPETALPAPTPVVLPVLPAEASTGYLLPLQIGALFSGPHRTVCRDNEVKSYKMVATLYTPKKRAVEIKTILNLMNAARECENQKPDGANPPEPPPAEVADLEDTEEAETEEVEGPAEAPQPEIPQEVTEEAKPELRLSPLQCPTEPQD